MILLNCVIMEQFIMNRKEYVNVRHMLLILMGNSAFLVISQNIGMLVL